MSEPRTPPELETPSAKRHRHSHLTTKAAPPSPSYTPSPGRVALQISASLLANTGPHTTPIRTSDGETLQSCATILCIRSPYFRKLFSTAPPYGVPLPAKAAFEVLQFCYSGDSSVVRAALAFTRRVLRFEPDWKRPAAEEHVISLVGLMTAADTCQLPELLDWADDAMSMLLQSVPSLSCLSLQRLSAARLSVASRETAVSLIAERPRECFGVPECVIGRPGTEWTIAAERGLSVRDLGIDVLEEVMRLPFCNADEYLFQVLYFWLEQGLCLERGARWEDGEDRWRTDEERENLERVRALAEGLNLSAMRVLFLRDYVEPTGLVGMGRLLQAYRHHASLGAQEVQPYRGRDVEIKKEYD